MNRPPIESLVQNLRRASFAVHARFRKALGDRGLSMGQFVVLRTLGTSGRATTKDLARSMGVTTGNITGLIDKLQSEGLVVRQRSRTDRRVVHLEATRKGRALLEELRRAVVDESARAFDSWSAKDLQRLNELLLRVIDVDPCAC